MEGRVTVCVTANRCNRHCKRDLQKPNLWCFCKLAQSYEIGLDLETKIPKYIKPLI